MVHLMNWINAMRSRSQPNANVDHGFAHSIVTIMAAQSYWSGKRLYWNPQSEEIVDQPIKDQSIKRLALNLLGIVACRNRPCSRS